jgi:hypothetical protein
VIKLKILKKNILLKILLPPPSGEQGVISMTTNIPSTIA